MHESIGNPASKIAKVNTLKLLTGPYKQVVFIIFRADLTNCLLLSVSADGQSQDGSQSPASSRKIKSRTGSKGSRPQSTKVIDRQAKKRHEQENLLEAARELLVHFSHRNLDALLKVTKNTLEGLRKRISTSSLVHYLSGVY